MSLRFLLAFVILAAPTVLWSQEPPPIRVDVRLVNVFVNVTDATGAPVPGLTQDDFCLSEDGRPQKIAYFERDTGMPLSVVLAIDTSGSTHKDLCDREDRSAQLCPRAYPAGGSARPDGFQL